MWNNFGMTNKKKGSALVAVLLVMLMISAISIGIISRTNTNLNISFDTRKSQIMYQTADQRAEMILNKMKEYDTQYNFTISKTNPNYSNKTIGNLCSDLPTGLTGCPTEANIEFYKLDVSTTPPSRVQISHPYSSNTTSIAEIVRLDVSSGDTSESVKRAISVPIPLRVVPPSNVASAACATLTCPGGACKTISWKYDSTLLDPSSTSPNSISGFFIKNTYGSWLELSPTPVRTTADWKTNCEATGICNFDVCVPTGTKTYVKAVHAKKYRLDSEDVLVP